MLYESMLLFGVVAVASTIFAVALEQRHALYLRDQLQIVLFVVLALYFVWFWTHGGQTLAMQTWRIRLVTKAGLPVSAGRAFCRYLIAWMWFIPGLLTAAALEVKGYYLLLLPLANVVVWLLTPLLNKDRQFLHDQIVGTRLISLPRASHKPTVT